jgi:hypothetical protein
MKISVRVRMVIVAIMIAVTMSSCSWLESFFSQGLQGRDPDPQQQYEICKALKKGNCERLLQ